MTFAPGLSEPQNSSELACSLKRWHLPTGACGRVADILQTHGGDPAEASPLRPELRLRHQAQGPELLAVLTPGPKTRCRSGRRGAHLSQEEGRRRGQTTWELRARQGVPPQPHF